MGIINFALSGNYKRFYNDLKELSKINKKSPILMFIDTAICTLVLGSGMQDYLNYKFYEKSFKKRKTYVTIGYMAKAYKTLANIEYADFFSNKINFHKNFHKYAKRDFLSNEASYEEFLEFIQKYDEFVKKPRTGLGGGGVTKVSTQDIQDKVIFFENLKRDNCFLEELVKQDENWGALSPNSVNTLRVMTKAINGKSEIIFAATRVGSGQTIADNFHQGGMGVLVNLENGQLVGNGIDKKLNESEYSITNIKFDGFKIPYWNEIKHMVLEAALVNDKVNIVGWDVAISKNGPLIIEANRGPGFDLVQVLLKKGAKYMLEDMLKEVKDSKTGQEIVTSE